MKLVPLFDKVVLKQLVAEETTKSGIVHSGSGREVNQQAVSLDSVLYNFIVREHNFGG